MSNYFFLTGMLRSGTTLLNKILDREPSFCSAQSLTDAFMEEKRKFHGEKEIYAYHLFSNYFPHRYEFNEFNEFLEKRNFYKTYTNLLPEISGRDRIAGNKEILCEEFIPHLIENKVKVILCIRNPNDVITSMHLGMGHQFAGAHRPILFDLRNWRKSIAFAINCASHENFLLVKYEDLVLNTRLEIDRIEQFLKIKLPTDSPLLVYDKGKEWKGNSSFSQHLSGISRQSVGISELKLPAEILKFTKAICFPEMIWCGYLSKQDQLIDYESIQSFKDPYIIERPEFYEFNYQEELDREISRLKELEKDNTQNKSDSFIFTETYEILKREIS